MFYFYNIAFVFLNSVPNCGRIRPMWPNWTLTWPRDFYFFSHFFHSQSGRIWLLDIIFLDFGYFFKKLTFSKKYFVILAQLCFKSWIFLEISWIFYDRVKPLITKIFFRKFLKMLVQILIIWKKLSHKNAIKTENWVKIC